MNYLLTKRKVLLMLIWISFVLFTALFSCKDNPVDPYANLEPGRRDYEWTVDTIEVPIRDYLLPMRMWGSSPNDIWIVGEADVTYNNIWHFDGSSWQNIPVAGLYNPLGIFGFSKDQVWLSNAYGEFWNYNGTSWKKHSRVSFPDFDIIDSQNIWGCSTNNIYSVGFRETYNIQGQFGTIVKYDGSKWKILNIPNIPGSFISVKCQVSTGWYFIDAFNSNTATNPYSIFVLKNDSLKMVHTGNKITTVSSIGDEAYLLIDKSIFKYENDKLHLWKDFSGTNYQGRIWGRTEYDFFTNNYDGIGHFNGTDLITIYKTNIGISEAIIFDKDVFFLAQGSERYRFFVIHGKLK